MITPSLSAASATESLIVEAGLRAAGESQPLVNYGQDASAGRLNRDHGPFMLPKASIAACRTTGSSPPVTSPSVISDANELVWNRS